MNQLNEREMHQHVIAVAWLNIAANALPLRRGDNVLIADTEYVQVPIPWATKRDSMSYSEPTESEDSQSFLR